MIKEKIMKKQAVILAKPSGTITIAGELTAIQRKFYDAFLYSVQETLKKNPQQLWFTITLADLKETLNTKEKDKNNKYYKEEIKKIRKIEVSYNTLRKDKIIEEGYSNLITDLKFLTNPETGEVKVKYNIPNMVREAILNKNKDSIFARIDLAIKKNLRHRYSLILYDLLKDYENVEIPEIPMEKFREIFGIKGKYETFANLRKRVLEPTIKELNENPDIEWNIKVELIKNGPKYTHIKFIKTPKPLRELEKQKAQGVKNKNYKQIVEKLIELIPEKYRKKYIKKLLLRTLPMKGYEYLQKQIEYTNKAKPKNYIAYLKQAIAEDYADMEQQALLEAIEQKRKVEEKARIKAENERKKAEIEEFEKAKREFESLPKEKQLDCILKIAKENSFVKKWVDDGIDKNWDKILPLAVDAYKNTL